MVENKKHEKLEADQLHIYPDNFQATKQSSKANQCYAIVDQELFKRFEKNNILVYSPSRKTSNGRIIKCYDDRYIVKQAANNDGVIISSDNCQDKMEKSLEWNKVT